MATSKSAESGLKGVMERVGEARRALDETAHKASELVSDFADEAVDRSRKAARYAVREVKEHPVTTLAVGAAVGVLVAAILMRRRD
jgi:ElaB/YqjD/DUF883 family membrane-anchored ribosome-binding protein